MKATTSIEAIDFFVFFFEFLRFINIFKKKRAPSIARIFTFFIHCVCVSRAREREGERKKERERERERIRSLVAELLFDFL